MMQWIIRDCTERQALLRFRYATEADANPSRLVRAASFLEGASDGLLGAAEESFLRTGTRAPKANARPTGALWLLHAVCGLRGAQGQRGASEPLVIGL